MQGSELMSKLQHDNFSYFSQVILVQWNQIGCATCYGQHKPPKPPRTYPDDSVPNRCN